MISSEVRTLIKATTTAAMLLRALPVLAQSPEPQASAQPMDSAGFQEFVQGRTLTYLQDGAPYGAEQYFTNNRVRWAFDDGTCLDGTWYQQEQNICFAYDDGSTPQCWLFYKKGSTLEAHFQDSEDSAPYEAQVTKGPLACTAPGLGV